MLVTRLYRRFFVLLSAAMLAGCSGDDSSETVGGTHEICFNADVGEVKAGTRWTSVDDADDLHSPTKGGKMVITAYFHGTDERYIDNALFSYDGASGNWKGVTSFYWPVDGSEFEDGDTPSLDFVGYWPADATNSSEDNKDRYYIRDFSYTPGTDVFSFDCNMSSIDPNDIREFMYASSLNQTYSSNSGVVPLHFQHPFARIKFQLSDVSVNAGVSINTISVTGLKSQGSYTSTDGWKGQTGNLGGDIGVIINDMETEFPFVVPFKGTIGITVNANWTDWGEIFAHTVSTNIDVDWSPGTSYTYTLTITPTDLRVDVNKYTEQW